MTPPLPAATTSSGLSPPVELLVDPDDTGECVAELGARHDLERGVAVCHPRPGAAPLPVLGEDVLVALGKRPGGLVAEGVSRRGWELAGLWLRAERIEHLVVLRAHRLPPARWRELAALTAAAGTRLWLVAHQGGLGTGHRAALDDTGTGRGGLAPGRPWRVALSLLPTPAKTVLGMFPEVPDVEFPLFRTAARRLLDPAGFARVDAVYRPTLLAARDLARRWTRPGAGLASIDPHQGAAALQRHTIDATSVDEVLTQVRAVQAGFCTEGVFLQLPRRQAGLPAGIGYAPRLDPAAVERLRGLCSPTAAAALAVARATGLRAAALRSLRVRDVHDTGPDQLLVAGRTLYRIPASIAGMVRAAIGEHHTQRAHHPTTARETGTGGAGLFVGTEPGTVIGELALQNALDRAATYTGVSALGPVFRGVEVHDLRGGWW
jgi:hypothetical protein